jgi:hypothetical protein
MRNDDYLMLQTCIICVLLALIGTTMVFRHPDWFGGQAKTTTATSIR